MPPMFGWVNQPSEVARVMQSLPHPIFAKSASGIMGQELRDALLFLAEQILFGKTLPAADQETGDCVSQATARALDDTRLADIVTRREREEWVARCASEWIYGAGRAGKQIGGAGMVGAWAAEVVTKSGAVLRQKYQDPDGRESVDLTNYSGRRADEWGVPSRGAPRWLYPIAAPHTATTTSLIRSAREGALALGNGYGIACASNLGFTMQRDSRGMCRRYGSWAHCMAWRGYAVLKGNIPAILWQQSWGNSPTGPNRVTLESGQEVTIPEGSFFSDMDTADLGARQGDCWVFGNVNGWRPRTLDWARAVETWN